MFRRTCLIARMVALCLGCIVASLPARAGSPFDAALAAYDRGDYGRARLLWEEALSQGDWDAARSLGHLYRRGLGVKADPKRAAAYYGEAAEHGVVVAEVNLAELYITGQGVERDIVKAKQLLADAALQGCAPAKERLDEILAAEARHLPPPPLPPDPPPHPN